MKINELNQPKKIVEGAVSDLLIGPAASDFFSSLFKKEDPRHKRALAVFINDFVGDARTSLDNGIKSGMIDPELVSDEPATGPAGGDDPSTPTTPPAPTPPSPAPSSPSSTKSSYTADTMGAARQFNKSVTKAQAAKADTRVANEKLKRDAQVAAAKPAFQQTATDRVTIQKAKQAGLLSESYKKLNLVFESILKELDSTEQMSISDYMTDWFDQYMNGVNWQTKKNIVLPAIKEIENTYGTDGGKAAIQKLARMAFALSGPAGQLPAGAKNAVQAPAAPAPAAPSYKKVNPDQVAADLASLKPKEREEVISKVKAAGK